MEKYSGKKIKCKSCANIISIPVFNPSSDGFEVVTETAPTQVVLRNPTPSQQSTSPVQLNRNRASGIRGAVNIALLQRNEPSRESIRNNFLEVNGSEVDRIPDSVIPFIAKNKEINSQIEKLCLDKIPWLKDVLARALSTNSDNSVGENLTASAIPIISFFSGTPNKLTKSDDEDAYSFALGILGGPIRPIPPAITVKYESMPNLFGFGSNSSFSKFQKVQSVGQDRAAIVRQIKIDTIKAAIEVSETTNNLLISEKESNNCEYDNIIFQHSTLSKQILSTAKDSISNGNLISATESLQTLVRSAPIEMISQVLVCLSQCTYLSGNAANSARHIQDAICFGASAPVNMDSGYNDLWAKANSGLPKS